MCKRNLYWPPRSAPGTCPQEFAMLILSLLLACHPDPTGVYRYGVPLRRLPKQLFERGVACSGKRCGELVALG